MLGAFRYVVDSCTCESTIEIISDGATVIGRCDDCKAAKAIGRTSEERRENMIESHRDGVPDAVGAELRRLADAYNAKCRELAESEARRLRAELMLRDWIKAHP